MAWAIDFLPEADAELRSFDVAAQSQIRKGLRKVAQNPLPATEGGYGKPLRNGATVRLAGLCKIKFKGIGVRVVYKPIRTEQEMLIVVVGIRSDDEAYRIAGQRRLRYGI